VIQFPPIPRRGRVRSDSLGQVSSPRTLANQSLSKEVPPSGTQSFLFEFGKNRTPVSRTPPCNKDSPQRRIPRHRYVISVEVSPFSRAAQRWNPFGDGQVSVSTQGRAETRTILTLCEFPEGYRPLVVSVPFLTKGPLTPR
jgi:hypothetical protein